MNKRTNKAIIKDDCVIKKKNDRVLKLYEYLKERGFEYYPKVIKTDDDTITYEYIDSKNNHELISGSQMIELISILHSKTIEYKPTSKNLYKKIYESVSGNIEYLKKYYEGMISNIEENVYMSPSEYLFARNYSIIDSALKYSSDNIKKWFKMVSNKSKQRVCVIHNNLSRNHFIKGDKNYLISFDNYLVDTPILDLYKFFKNDGYKLDFKSLLDIYEENNKLDNDEKLLLNILISIPPKITWIDKEYENTLNIKSHYKYIYSSMNFVNQNK